MSLIRLSQHFHFFFLFLEYLFKATVLRVCDISKMFCILDGLVFVSNYLSVQYFLPPSLSHLTFVLLTISDVSEFSASSTVGLWRSDADVFSGDELPEKANIARILVKLCRYFYYSIERTHIST